MISVHPRSILNISISNFAIFIIIFKKSHLSMPCGVVMCDNIISCIILGWGLYKVSNELSHYKYGYASYLLTSSLLFLPFLLFAYMNNWSTKDVVIYGGVGILFLIPSMLLTRRESLFTTNKGHGGAVKALLFSVILIIMHIMTKKILGHNIYESMLFVFYSAVIPMGYASQLIQSFFSKIFRL